jgi:ABC-type thiamin/hydroxymethylpyrimidine transport system permease subunit
MPLNQRKLAMTAAVFAFFMTSIVAAFCKNAPYTCCKRALIAMIAAYIFITIIVRIINAILVDAIISRQVDKTLNRFKGKGNSNGGTG